MRFLVPILIVLVVIGALIINFYAGNLFFDTWAERGQFGDLFGSVNALFAGLAFAGLIYAILLQRQELGLQREELRLQRREMVASREQLAAQAEAQNALFHATVGQIQVAASQARIEAIKMGTPTQHTASVRKSVSRIQEQANHIEALASRLGEIEIDE